jgi:hypothetical protein
MQIETEEILLEKCRKLIEQRLGWGDSEQWTSQDYESLCVKIAETTNVTLSVATLKRIWGKVRYDSKPTITTLNTLAQYLGYENWRAFKLDQSSSNENGHSSNGHDAKVIPDKVLVKKNYSIILATGVVLSAAAFLIYFTFARKEVKSVSPDHSLFSFSSKKIVDEGVPNTVIFDYDASAALPTDSIFIQQSWDKRLSRQVTRDEKQHSSIYYYPGYFQAKLRINNEVMKEHSLYIKTHGWLPVVDQNPVPVYFKEEEARQQGSMSLSIEKIKQFNVSLQPEAPWTSYYFVNDVGDIYSNDFIFEAEIRNDYSEGSAACQSTEVHLIFEGAAMVVPLIAKGCVSELMPMLKGADDLDVTALGADFTQWIKVRSEMKDSVGQVLVNNKKAYGFTTRMKPLKIAGVAFRFRGTGSINSARLSTHNGTVVWEETFE